ncbi:glycoside hydrolase family 2 protein [Persicobacter diffluens]|uniref:Beta-galactosidase n=1 Tax=Persicobacter diffluens TaxID=981 RepID=A0AAN4W3C8_9BACT|nr:beta-galactosidase [Persicobacter diffluens]
MKIIINLLILCLINISVFASSTVYTHRKNIELKAWKFYKGNINQAKQTDYVDHDWEMVQVPHTYSMEALTEVGYYRGPAWYRKALQVPSSMKGERIFIRFEGVGNKAEVFVNGKKIGVHKGGYSAFCFELTDHLSGQGTDQLAVKVTNAPNFKFLPVTDNLFNIYGGIYRPVTVFSTPKSNISPLYHATSGVFVNQLEVNQKTAEIELSAHLQLGDDHAKTVLCQVFDPSGKKVFDQNLPLPENQREYILKEKISIDAPKLWHGKRSPKQYRVVVKLPNGDQVSEQFGLRTFAVDAEKGFFLNGEPYRLYGVAMHQEWRDVGPALTMDHHQKDMELVQEIGASALRLSHYQHSEITYEQADEAGLVVWAEIPFVHDYSGRERDNAHQQLTELILQNYNHPSICFWGIWNEVRAYDSPEEACVPLTKSLNSLAHELDPSRLTTSASDRGMVSNMGNITDLQAWNKYFGWYYGEFEDMATFLDESHHDFPDRPIGISEYGIGGNVMHQQADMLEKPSGRYFPEMVQTQYHELTWKILKDRPFVWASFVWNMFDFSVAGWNRGGTPFLNHKGLVSYDRKTKKDAFYFYKANWSDEPVLYIEGRRNDQRAQAETEMKVFTNAEKVTFYLNGKKISHQKNMNPMHTLVFNEIHLNSGKNELTVEAKIDGKRLKDTVYWHYQASAK